MQDEKIYNLEMKKYAKNVEKNFFKHFNSENNANLEVNQHKMLLEGLLKDFDFSLIQDEDFEKIELYDFWKGENDRTSKKR